MCVNLCIWRLLCVCISVSPCVAYVCASIDVCVCRITLQFEKEESESLKEKRREEIGGVVRDR